MNIKDPRICAICLRDIERDLYNEHMQQAHGYETLILTFDNSAYLEGKLGSYDLLDVTAENVLYEAEYTLVEVDFWDPT